MKLGKNNFNNEGHLCPMTLFSELKVIYVLQ